MDNEEIFFSWMMYGKLLEFGVFSEIWLRSIAGGFTWVM